MGLVSVVKVAEAYARHGGELVGLSRAVRAVANQLVVWYGWGGSGCGCVWESMGHRAAMRGRRRVGGGRGAWVGLIRATAVLGLGEVAVSETAEGGCERATTAIIKARRGG